MAVIYRDDFVGAAGSVDGRVNSGLTWAVFGGTCALDGSGNLIISGGGSVYVDIPASLFDGVSTVHVEVEVTREELGQRLTAKLVLPGGEGYGDSIPGSIFGVGELYSSMGIGLGNGYTDDAVAMAPGSNGSAVTDAIPRPSTHIYRMSMTVGSPVVSIFKDDTSLGGDATSVNGNVLAVVDDMRLYLAGDGGVIINYIEVRDDAVPVASAFWTDFQNTFEVP